MAPRHHKNPSKHPRQPVQCEFEGGSVFGRVRGEVA